MSFKKVYGEISRHFDCDSFRKHVEVHCSSGLKQFKKIVRSHLFFHLLFLGILVGEMIAFSLSFTFLSKSILIVFCLAGIILTVFAYLVILFYFETKKPQEFIELRNWFMHLCKQSLPKDLAVSEYHLFLANSAYRFASHLVNHASTSYMFPFFHQSIKTLLNKLVHFSHHKDIHRMKEMLLLVSIAEHVQLIKQIPKNLEAHASLANTYTALAKIYRGDSKEVRGKHRRALEKAIQEFKVLDYYSPNDPWVQAQLASCYHDLNRRRDEILHYENILKLCPNDKQILFRLGVLYFHQGLNAKGLAIYEKLKTMNFPRAEKLIHYYEVTISQEEVEST